MTTRKITEKTKGLLLTPVNVALCFAYGIGVALAGVLLLFIAAEDRVLSIFSSQDKVNAIAAICSAIAACMAFVAANKSASSTKSAAITACLPYRLKTRAALIIIWSTLNNKTNKLRMKDPYDKSDPFLFSIDEIEKIEHQKNAMTEDSAFYGLDFHKKAIAFYAFAKSKLEVQTGLRDCDSQGPMLTPETQKEYLKIREEYREQAMELLMDAEKLLYKELPSESGKKH